MRIATIFFAILLAGCATETPMAPPQAPTSAEPEAETRLDEVEIPAEFGEHHISPPNSGGMYSASYKDLPLVWSSREEVHIQVHVSWPDPGPTVDRMKVKIEEVNNDFEDIVIATGTSGFSFSFDYTIPDAGSRLRVLVYPYTDMGVAVVTDPIETRVELWQTKIR